MSDSLPYSGVEIVEVMRNAVVAHACSEKPLRSSAIVRMAVETTVWSSAARNIPIIRPMRIITICRWVKPPSLCADVALRVAGVVMRAPALRRLAYQRRWSSTCGSVAAGSAAGTRRRGRR